MLKISAVAFRAYKNNYSVSYISLNAENINIYNTTAGESQAKATR